MNELGLAYRNKYYSKLKVLIIVIFKSNNMTFFLQGYNALHYASVASNSFEALVYFIENVPPDNSALSNASVTKAMQLAATYGYDIALSVLLSKLEHPNAYDDHGRTALHLAASNVSTILYNMN